MPFMDVVFDGPPSHESGRFVEVEDSHGRSVAAGTWIHRNDGYWVLRFTPGDVQAVADREPPDPAGFEGGFAENH